MNFHKTIGFLATLLLIVGLGVPDSFAQTQGTMTLEFTETRAQSVLAGTDNAPGVKLIVTLDPAPDAAAGIAVSVRLAPVFLMTRDASEDPVTRIASGSSVNITVGTDGTGESDEIFFVDNHTGYFDLVYLHANVAEQTITAGGESVTYPRFFARLKVQDVQRPTSTNRITIEAALPSLNANAGSAQTVTLTVTMEPAPETGVRLLVTANHLQPDGNWAFSISDPNDVVLSAGATEGTTALILPANAPEGIVSVRGGVSGYRSGTLDIPVIARSAGDVEGFRVTMLPADGAWIGFGKKKVKVEVTRVNRYAHDWKRFSSIKVALRDTLPVTGLGSGDTEGDIYSLTASSFNNDDGEIVFSTAASSGGAFPGNNNITYNEAGDKLLFEFELVSAADATAAATALGTATNTDDSRAGDTANGQRRGVFARATFTPPGGSAGMINSNDTKTEVFSSPALLATVPAADKKVGDGKLIKIDLMAPPNIAAGNLAVTRENEDGDDVALVADTKLKIGDEIDIAVNVDSQSRFRDAGVQIQVIATETAGENTTATVVQTTLKTVNFSQVDVFNAAGDALMASLALTEGLIEGKVKANAKARDGSAIKKNALYEPDNVTIRVRARTKDQAGNFSGGGAQLAQLELVADTRKPEINFLYPASGDYFSGAIGDTDTGFDQFLKPLKLIVDEMTASMAVYVHKNHKINLWASENLNYDRGLVVGGVNNKVAVGDTIIYDTLGLKINNKDGGEGSAAGGSKVTLTFEVTDLVGNKNTVKLAGVFHDETAPEVTEFFPRNDLLNDDNEINDATRHPVITLPETVDSIAVVYDGSAGDDIVEEVSGINSGEVDVAITEAFVDGRTYTLTIFARDRAGNAAESDPALATGMRFNAQFDNPKANAFMVANETGGTGDDASAGVIAGQAFKLVIQAFDDGGTSDDADDRNAVTYKNVDADGNMASEVRISASSSSVRFSGGGVTDNGDGSATLNAAGWKLGKRTVHAKSEMAIDATTIMVQHLNGDGDEVFSGSIADLYVDAADFAKFTVTAMQGGVDVTELNPGAFELEIVPTDKYGNASTKAFAMDPSSVADSLALLDSAVAKNNATNVEFDTIPVDFRSIPAYDDLSLGWDFTVDGDIFDLDAPADRSRVTITISIVDDDLEPSNARTEDIRTQRVSFAIVAPLMPALTLWVPGVEGDQAGEDVSIPADAADVTVTVNAEGYKAGSMVTFTKNGTAMDAVAANDDGTASLMITMSEAGDVTVSATDGRYETGDLTITFVAEPDEPVRMAFEDSEGNAVYLVDLTDNTVDSGDYALFRAAWGKSASDDINGDGMADDTDVQIFLQCDIHPEAGDGMVNSLDYALFITSWNKTAANGPASKPIVLLPGINENAEFSLNLGSERVVAGEMVAVDVSLANVEALVAYGFTLNYDTDKFEFVSVAPADEDLLTSTGGESMLFHNMLADGQIEVVNGVFDGTAVSGGGDIVRFVFRVLYEFEDNARFEIANGLVFDPTHLTNPAVVAGVLELQSTPREFALHQNFPNPFNPDTTIKYDLAESADVTLQIYNVLGQVVRTLVASEAQNAGRYQIRWNGMDDRGVPVSSGVYFYQISAAGKFSQVQKLMLLK